MKMLAALVGLAGGIGLFIFGMQMCSEGLQKMAAHRLKQMAKTLTSNSFCGLLVGIAVTFGLQSSSATSALIVGFVGAGLMGLAQALGVLLGSALGASLTTQLIAFKISGFALALIFIGVILYMFSKRLRLKYLGQTILGFGILFYGMFVMSSSMAPVRDYPVVAQTLISLEKYPVWEFLVAMFGTAIIQSSPAFLALLMALASHGLMGPYAIVPFVLGAHLGGTVTGVLSSLGAPGRDAKRAALANFGFKLLNGLVFLPFYRPLTDLALWSSSDLSREIANTHTFFSLAMALGFLPFTRQAAKIMERLIPDEGPKLGDARYLDESLLQLPELAVDQAQRQTLEMGCIVGDEMLKRVLPSLRYGNDELLDRIARTESAVDALYKKISQYVTGIANNSLTDNLMQRTIQILYTVNDLEHIGDIVMTVAQITRKIKAEEVQFSEEGFGELTVLFNSVFENYHQSLEAFENGDVNLATQVIKEHPKIQRLEKEFRFNHFDRMQSGNSKTITSSAVHLDLIEAMLRIDSHAVSISQGVMGIV